MKPCPAACSKLCATKLQLVTAYSNMKTMNRDGCLVYTLYVILANNKRKKGKGKLEVKLRNSLCIENERPAYKGCASSGCAGSRSNTAGCKSLTV